MYNKKRKTEYNKAPPDFHTKPQPMTTEATTPIIDAPADAPVESAALDTADGQSSTQVESENAAPSEIPSAAVEEKEVANATETIVQPDVTGDAPAKEAMISDIAKTESSPVNELIEGIRVHTPHISIARSDSFEPALIFTP